MPGIFCVHYSAPYLFVLVPCFFSSIHSLFQIFSLWIFFRAILTNHKCKMRRKMNNDVEKAGDFSSFIFYFCYCKEYSSVTSNTYWINTIRLILCVTNYQSIIYFLLWLLEFFFYLESKYGRRAERVHMILAKLECASST